MVSVAAVIISLSLTACEREVAEEGMKQAAVKTEEAIPLQYAEAYKNVLAVTEVEGVAWERGVITAVGRGVPPARITHPGQAKILAMRAAKVDGYRNLLKTILTMRTPDRAMEQYLEENNIRIERIEGFIKGARVLKEEYREDGSAEVLMELPITGGNGLVALLKQGGE